MRMKPFHLKRAGTLAQVIDDDASLTMVYGEGGGSMLDVTGGAVAVCIPLHGHVQVRSAGLTWVLFAGEALTTEHDTRVSVVGYGNAQWLAVLGGRRAWAEVLPAPVTGTQLLSGPRRADREMRRLAIAMARVAHPSGFDGPLSAMIDKLVATQAPLYEAIARCPGRTWTNKRQVFMRLQRVHNYISVCCDQELDIHVLAKMANYSPCHFLRTFHMVYQTTPHAYVIEQRLQRAWKLLRSGNLAITEVGVACGFENRSAFSRLFHQRFGVTAQEAKRTSGSPRPDANVLAA